MLFRSSPSPGFVVFVVVVVAVNIVYYFSFFDSVTVSVSRSSFMSLCFTLGMGCHFLIFPIYSVAFKCPTH